MDSTGSKAHQLAMTLKKVTISVAIYVLLVTDSYHWFRERWVKRTQSTYLGNATLKTAKWRKSLLSKRAVVGGVCGLYAER